MAFYTGICWSDDESHNSNSLDACFLCRKSLGFDSDIFMYRGNTPFCSRECRQEQIEIDELKEKKSWKLQSESSNKDSSTSNTVRTNTVVVA